MNQQSPKPYPQPNRQEGLLDLTWHSLRAKLMVAFVMIGTLSAGVVAGVNGYWMQQNLIAEKNEDLRAAATKTALALDNFIQDKRNQIRIQAQLSLFANYLELPTAERPPLEPELLGTLRTLSGEDRVLITSYALLDGAGHNVVDTYGADIGADESTEPYFNLPFTAGLPYVSPVQLTASASEMAALHFSAPVRNKHGQIIGVLRARYNANVLQDIVGTNNGLAGTGSFPILLDENHIRLAHGTNPDLIFKSVVPLSQEQVATLQAKQRLPPGDPTDLATNIPEFEAGLATVNTDTPYFTTRLLATETKLDQAAVVKINTMPWLVAFVQPQEIFLAPIFIQIQRTILVTVGVMALVIIGAIIIGGRLTRPIVNLMVAAERIAAGSLDTRAKAESHDEIGQLALAFNGMAEQLQVSFTTLERTNEELQAANSQLQQEMLEREVMEQERAQLQQEVITAQQQAIRELSTPIIPLMEQIIILPLIGTIDSTRARDLTRSLLAGISHHRARVVILDLTGVPAIDGSIAGHLDKTLQAARLKGAQTILTGISEEVAETLTELGIAAAWQPSGVRTVSNLQAGLALALKQLRG